MAAPAGWTLVTGQPGSGKTTLVRTVCDALSARGHRLRGFYTDEVCDRSGVRIGFDVVTIPDGRRGVLSRKQGLPAAWPKVGQYTVDVAAFEALALPTLATPSAGTMVVVDEIGRMELRSEAFRRAIEELLLAQPATALFGAITAPIYGHRVPFCDAVAEDPRVDVRRITAKTRDAVRAAVLEDLLSSALVKPPARATAARDSRQPSASSQRAKRQRE